MQNINIKVKSDNDKYQSPNDKSNSKSKCQKLLDFEFGHLFVIWILELGFLSILIF